MNSCRKQSLYCPAGVPSFLLVSYGRPLACPVPWTRSRVFVYPANNRGKGRACWLGVRPVCQSVSRSCLFERGISKFNLLLNCVFRLVFQCPHIASYGSPIHPSSDVYSARNTPMALRVKKKKGYGLKHGNALLPHSRNLTGSPFFDSYFLPRAGTRQAKERKGGAQNLQQLHSLPISRSLSFFPYQFFFLMPHSWTILDAGACIFVVFSIADGGTMPKKRQKRKRKIRLTGSVQNGCWCHKTLDKHPTRGESVKGWGRG